MRNTHTGHKSIKALQRIIDNPQVTELTFANALFYKGVALGKIKKSDEAVTIYDQLIEKHSLSERYFLQEIVASTLLKKGHYANRKI